MARRKGWFVQINKKQVPLGADPDPKPKGKPKPPAEVMREYYRVMGANGITSESDRDRALVPEVCEAFLAVKEKMRASTVDKYKFWLRRFSEGMMAREFKSVRKTDIEKIAEANEQWSSGTKHDYVRSIVTLFRWARDAGYLDFNPLAGWENPYPCPRRDRCLEDSEFTALMDYAKDIQFKQIMMFLRGTGCRPGEAFVVGAKHLHPSRPLLTLKPEEHKTGRRTGKSRVLIMPDDVEVMVRALASRFPIGPLFRNSRNGGGWKRSTLYTRFRKYRRKLGLPEDVTPYMIRHATLTRILDGGTDAHLAAKMAGHAGTNTLQSTYYHPDVEKMIEASNKAHKRKPKA
jgi:integrase